MTYEDDLFADGGWFPLQRMIQALEEAGIRDMNRVFHCVYLEQGTISCVVRELLLRSAVAMTCMKRNKFRFKTDWCEGQLITRYSSASIEAISGIKFECRLDIDNRTTKATFLVTTSFLERFKEAAWLAEVADDDPIRSTHIN